MEEKQLSIYRDVLKIVSTKYEHVPNTVTFDYINRASDIWYEDIEESVEIDKDKAIEIIAFLTDAFELNKTQEA